jgi:hypothetical protein
MLDALFHALGIRRRPRHRIIGDPAYNRLVITEQCLPGLKDCLGPEIDCGHEGIAYFYGQTDGITTLIAGAIRPAARTTPGSFDVSAVAMARVVRKISDSGLQLVGQVHSHPGQAYHSEGDENGARIAYRGFVSIVLPDYGRCLPSLEGAAMYIFRDGSFTELHHDALTIVPQKL